MTNVIDGHSLMISEDQCMEDARNLMYCGWLIAGHPFCPNGCRPRKPRMENCSSCERPTIIMNMEQAKCARCRVLEGMS